MKKIELRTWVGIAEIAASLAVLASLIVLILQIREDGEMERRAASVRAAEWDTSVFLQSDLLAGALARIKAVDGIEGPVQELMTRYDMSYEQAAAWNRYIILNWRGLEMYFQAEGPSEPLARAIRRTVAWPDQQILLAPVFGKDWSPFDPAFDAYVLSVMSGE